MATLTATTKSDRQIREDVLSALRWEPIIDAANIAVTSRDGIVTLSGYVQSYLAKMRAADAAKGVYGVRAVVNELEVRLDEEKRRPDEQIADEAVSALKWNLFVPSKKIKVSVSKGWVTLEGQVNWKFQKRAAEEAVQSIEGVASVVNRIKIAPSVSPTELKDDIEDALRRRAELDAKHIDVTIDGDIVTLRGVVKSWAQRQAAEDAAWAAPGISHVENLITVEP